MFAPREFKRRKMTHNGDLSSDKNCSLKDQIHSGQLNSHSTIEEAEEEEDLEEVGEDIDEALLAPKEPIERIVPFENRGLSARLLQLSLGTTRSRRANIKYPVNGIFTPPHLFIHILPYFPVMYVLVY